MKNSPIPGFSSKIIRIYLIGAKTLLLFYIFIFHAGTMLTENVLMERRINIVSQFHFERYRKGEEGIIVIDPLLTLYDAYEFLPVHIRHNIGPDWTGTLQLHVDGDNPPIPEESISDEDVEYQVIATTIDKNGHSQIVYAVENSNAAEWDDSKLIVVEVAIAFTGLVLFGLTALYMVRAARRIALPFLTLAQQLESDSPDNFEHIKPVGEQSTELLQIIKGLNTYRSGMALQLQREKSFTRYVSHELRTPMMIIKGAISNIRQGSLQNKNKAVDKIENATEQMQELTQTFLLLARDRSSKPEHTFVDGDFLQDLCAEMEHSIAANEINFNWQLSNSYTLQAQSLLVKAVILNLLKNAFACSINGNVNLYVSASGIEVIDDGVGLDAKPRSYEGFGVGLVLVEDICKKYDWQFSLINNEGKGCTAAVKFANSESL